ncbi:hypothetical protein ACQU0X_32045 [Pseudovibrio ascidiaceicola]|uniref:hypothetical protein n=1 Tax=Pseudovibrio ascidiaceicola TaxID=285279 RepID=UPI003D367AA9
MTSEQVVQECGITAIECWVGLQVELDSWNLKFDETGENLHPLKDKTNLVYLEFLKGFPARKWALIGDGAGWTPVSAMALSWCEGTTWDGVLKAWEAIKNLDLESDATSLSAQMTNPKFLPDPDLATVLKLGQSPGGAWVLLSALKLHDKPVRFDETQVSRNSVHSVLWPLIEQ